MIRWLLPVESVRGENEQIAPIAQDWLRSEYALTQTSPLEMPSGSLDPSLVFRHHLFPFYAFVPACLSVDTSLPSMSISNRRRLWGIVQQFQAMWEDYRTKGWERDDMFSMVDVEGSSDADTS
jgi:hypothetical protein